MRNVRTFSFAAAVAGALSTLIAAGGLVGATPAGAQECPGNPNALGTSRVLEVDPATYPRVGLMQYPESLPLADKEVVITFDDGPLPRYSDQVLAILAAQCVRVTYFMVGQMANAFPDAVRRAYRAGHTIGTHSQNHPTRFQKLPVERVRQQIDDGIASVGAALGDPREVAPFFRIPGLAHTDAIEQELAARSLVTFSADVVADDWHHHIKPAQIVTRAMSRLAARGKGILLLHDIHPATAAALPGLLKALKDQGYRIVHVVPAPPSTPTPPATVVAAPASRQDSGAPSPPQQQPAMPVAEPASRKDIHASAAPLPAEGKEIGLRLNLEGGASDAAKADVTGTAHARDVRPTSNGTAPAFAPPNAP